MTTEKLSEKMRLMLHVSVEDFIPEVEALEEQRDSLQRLWEVQITRSGYWEKRAKSYKKRAEVEVTPLKDALLKVNDEALDNDERANKAKSRLAKAQELLKTWRETRHLSYDEQTYWQAEGSKKTYDACADELEKALK
jgi:hypothetical protein